MKVYTIMNMHKLLLTTATTVVALSFFAGPAFTQNSKFSAIVDNVQISVEGEDSSLLHQRMTTVKISGNKALLLGVSSQIAIETETKVKGNKGGGGSATATGDVRVAVAVAPAGTALQDITSAPAHYYAMPGEIAFSMRSQELSAVLGGVFETDDGGHITEISDEEIGLILNTLAAHHFNFVWEAPETGEYDVHLLIEAKTDETTWNEPTDEDNNVASATVIVGPNVLTIEEVRTHKGGIMELDE